jgi:hypothetical protein
MSVADYITVKARHTELLERTKRLSVERQKCRWWQFEKKAGLDIAIRMVMDEGFALEALLNALSEDR